MSVSPRAAHTPTTDADAEDDEQSRSKWPAKTAKITAQQKLNTYSPSPSPTLTSTSLSTPTSLHSYNTSNVLSASGGGSGGVGVGTSVSTATTTTKQRKSAFLPYRPHATVLTNLQRGNTEATFCTVEVSLSFHERAGQGEITADQLSKEIERQRANGGTIDFKDAYGFTPLHWSAYYGQLHCVQLLVDAGADVNMEAPEMVTPLLLAASGGHHEIVRLLLERGAKSTHMDIMGNTALMYAAAGNFPHTCNELLAKSPDLTLSNEDGDTAYTLAVANGAVLAQAVLEHYLRTLLDI